MTHVSPNPSERSGQPLYIEVLQRVLQSARDGLLAPNWRELVATMSPLSADTQGYSDLHRGPAQSEIYATTVEIAPLGCDLRAVQPSTSDLMCDGLHIFLGVPPLRKSWSGTITMSPNIIGDFRRRDGRTGCAVARYGSCREDGFTWRLPYGIAGADD